MKCYHRPLGISCKDHITNVEVLNILTKTLGPQEDLLTTMKKRNQKCYEHVTKVNMTCQNNPARNSTRKEKERKTEGHGRTTSPNGHERR